MVIWVDVSLATKDSLSNPLGHYWRGVTCRKIWFIPVTDLIMYSLSMFWSVFAESPFLLSQESNGHTCHFLCRDSAAGREKKRCCPPHLSDQAIISKVFSMYCVLLLCIINVHNKMSTNGELFWFWYNFNDFLVHWTHVWLISICMCHLLLCINAKHWTLDSDLNSLEMQCRILRCFIL